jgi:predicted Zn finger-like uncharacterized protein
MPLITPMQIVCPNCKTAYQLADVAIGASGRAVRCARCQHQWRAAPPTVRVPAPSLASDETAVAALRTEPVLSPLAELDPTPAHGPDAAAAPAEPSLDSLNDAIASAPAAHATAPDEAFPLSLSDIPIPVEHAPLVPDSDPDSQPAAEMDNGLPDVESVAARRDRARKRQARWRLPLPVAIAILLALSAALLGLRKDVVRHAPQLASFYSAIGLPVNLRGLGFTDLKIGNEIHDGVPVLVIEGTIASMVSRPSDVPRLRFALRSATGAEVYSWTAPPPQPVLGAFETLPFRTRLASPPAEGHDVQVRFFTRRDTVAGLH